MYNALVSERPPFYAQLSRSWSESGSLLCVGIDPTYERLPANVSQDPEGLFEFSRRIADACAPHVCAFKPQAAHFGALGAEKELRRLIDYIHELHPHVVVVLDAKRGDIGSTAARYAVEAFERYDADAVTVSPFLGEESVRPYFDFPERGVILLCRTSNPGSDWMQKQPEDEPIYLQIVKKAQAWNEHRNLALVTGATYPEELQEVRAIAPEMPLLVPGIGAQGGDISRVVAAGADRNGQGLLISASRSVLFASDGDDYAEAAGAEAERLKHEIQVAVESSNYSR